MLPLRLHAPWLLLRNVEHRVCLAKDQTDRQMKGMANIKLLIPNFLFLLSQVALGLAYDEPLAKPSQLAQIVTFLLAFL